MKRWRSCVVVLLSGLATAAAFGSSIDRGQALALLVAEADRTNAGLSDVYLSAKPLPAGAVIASYRGQPVTAATTAWFGFIDDMPGANWDHPCRYILIDEATGKLTVADRLTPPHMITEMTLARRGRVPVRPPRPAGKIEGPGPRTPDRSNPEHLWAIIISGGASSGSNYPRYWNDSSQIYKALVNMYGYLDDHIYAAIADGTDPAADKSDGTSSNPDLDGDGDADITHGCSVANLTAIFADLAGRVGSNDTVFIYSTDHGSQESGHDALLNLYYSETLRDDQFAAYLATLDVRDIIVTMEQCFSGGFLEDVIAGGASQRIFSSGANWDEYSWAMPPDYVWDEYVYYWTAAVYWQYPDGTPVDADTSNDGIVDMHEAFLFAQAHDTADETPQYGDQPAGYGDTVSLFGSGPSSEGEIGLDRGRYACSDLIQVAVGDLDLAGSGTAAATLASSSDPTGITIALTETDDGIFEGAAAISTAPGPGELLVSAGDTLTASYDDENYGGAGPMTVTATALVDCTGPLVSAVAVEDRTGVSATVVWTTDEPADATVYYGTAVPPSSSAASSELTTAHGVPLAGLAPATLHYFAVESTDEAGNTTYDDNGGAYYTFMTMQRVVMLSADMSVNPGWTTEGQWAWGQPTGSGGEYGNPDPTSGYTGPNIYGYNLAGDYPNSMPEYALTTPAFDCSGAAAVTLDFWRYLNVETPSYDHAYVRVSNNNGTSWTTVWQNAATIEDSSWNLMELDLTALLAGYAQCRIRWVQGTSDGSWRYSGWNIDDVVVMYETEATPPTVTPTPTGAPPTATPTPTGVPPTPTPEPTGGPWSATVLLPFWQHGNGEQSFFGFYNSVDSATGLEFELLLFDESGANMVGSHGPTRLESGDYAALDTAMDGWYDQSWHYGPAMASLVYDSAPAPEDSLALWSCVYTLAGGTQPGFSVPVPASPFEPEPDRGGLRTGEGLVLLPRWQVLGSAVTGFSLWNSAASPHAVTVTIGLTDYSGQPAGTRAVTLQPGQFEWVETDFTWYTGGDGNAGTGVLDVQFEGDPDPQDELSIWSTVYGIYGGHQVGFPVGLGTSPAGSLPLASGPAAARATHHEVASPFWQVGLGLETVWSFASSPLSSTGVSVVVELYDAAGTNLIDSSTAVSLAPGQGTAVSTSEAWYDGGDGNGVARIVLDYDSEPALTDELAVWSAAYSVPDPSDAWVGFTVSVPESPIIPTLLPGADEQVFRAGEGKVLIPLWQNGYGLSTFFSIANHPGSVHSAAVTLHLRDGAGTEIETEVRTLAPGEAWGLDTLEGWYTSGEAYGPGEIEIHFQGGIDALDRVALWEAIYGTYNGYQAGYPVDLK